MVAGAELEVSVEVVAKNTKEYKEGYEAYSKRPQIDCPYKKGSKERFDWREGYRDALHKYESDHDGEDKVHR